MFEGSSTHMTQKPTVQAQQGDRAVSMSSKPSPSPGLEVPPWSLGIFHLWWHHHEISWIFHGSWFHPIPSHWIQLNPHKSPFSWWDNHLFHWMSNQKGIIPSGKLATDQVSTHTSPSNSSGCTCWMSGNRSKPWGYAGYARHRQGLARCRGAKTSLDN